MANVYLDNMEDDLENDEVDEVEIIVDSSEQGNLDNFVNLHCHSYYSLLIQ